jgi:alpha-tubulin suppressor-like RCC1 family protein
VAQGSIVFIELAVGQLHTCGVSNQYEAFCWGRGKAGQLGFQEEQVPTPTRVETELRFSSLAAGARHTCGISLEGRAYCWGWGQRGQLGHGRNDNSPKPVLVQGQETIN